MTSNRYPSGISTVAAASWTSAATSARGRPSTFAPTSSRRDPSIRRIMLGVDCISTAAMSANRTVPPDGVSMSMSRTSSGLRRASGTLHTMTS